MNNYSDLEKSILKTLAYFDIFDYPLTLLEIYKWLYCPPPGSTLLSVSQALDGENLKSEAESKNGFYFLRGRQNIIGTRLSRYRLAEKKFKIALKTGRWLKWLAFMRMIAVCNNAGYNNAAPSSDIDFFIIVKKGRLYFTRLWVTLLVAGLGRRRHAKKIADRVCLSFYITDSHLDLSDIALKPADIYLVYWLATLAPIYDSGAYAQFLLANGWLKDYLPNFYGTALSWRRKIDDKFCLKLTKGFGERFFSGFLGKGLEALAKYFQLSKMKKNPSFAGDGLKVIISDSMLKFHENDRRREYGELWARKVSALVN